MRYLSLSVLLVLLIYASVYMFIPVEGPIDWYVGTAVSRLYIHFVAIAVFWVAMACKERGLITEVEQ